jgi:hypothetical protein
VSVCSASFEVGIHCLLKGGLVSLTLFKFAFEVVVDFLHDLIVVLLDNNLFLDQSLAVIMCKRVLCSDLFIHLWLSEAGFIDFVVAVLSPSNHVD